MKRLFAVTLSVLIAVFALAGCGKNDVSSAEASKEASPSASSSPAAIAAPSPTSVSPKVSYPVQLSKTQLGDFEAQFNSDGNYGFLLSDYDDVTNVDLRQVLYNGAGMKEPANSSDIVSVAKASLGDSPDCDATVLTSQQINDFLKEKTGHVLTDMKKPLTWAYVKQYDAYVHFHGDTNRVQLSVDDGRETGEGTYRIDYTISGGFYDESGKEVSGGTASVKVSGISVQFISNKLH